MSNVGFVRRASKFFAVLGGIYVAIVLLLAVPFLQSHAVYMNAVKLPWNANYNTPEKYGMAPGKTSNIAITTADNVTLGAWFVLSDTYYHTLAFPPPPISDSHISKALDSYPTVLFFHGNGATRALSLRVHYYSAFSSRLHANVLAIDYRGFGDSEGTPSEKGLANDARAAWDWLISQGAKPENVLIIGHSLGTAVATKLAVDLSESNVNYKGVVLMSPFSSIRSLVDTYYILGLFPVMMPLTMIPHVPGKPWFSLHKHIVCVFVDLYKNFLIHDFDTLSVVHKIKASILILHADNDWDISFTHSEDLFNSLLETHLLPSAIDRLPLNPASWSQEEWHDYQAKQKLRHDLRQELVAHTQIPNFGSVDEFSVLEQKVVFLKTFAGGHDRVAMLEGVHDVIRNVFSIST
ncbi:hypothetical protein SERLA73DRAFT_91363 [Serpula lacrymans var. lacrymans S7.3]|uniref:AB hydrolase-1 domain-containing protein n=2 Tax=Serpula lacrymans var. lacrymans TaxID=341189 RepID=F8Q1F0_SERL3|nr:uncharacterized protein SERLADRAFT_469938 [Serpula lacrymans var. lacrymans S7.9]EGN98128.1 hypothetical protein SERLA73DRAFT_91363 [Serpula lacrymans var. lacrymans S7.3]EGO23708.1 hypothetical protein SERLADRAFT_469938 [Serpula lacrymans var. lacrymans S7.9]